MALCELTISPALFSDRGHSVSIRHLGKPKPYSVSISARAFPITRLNGMFTVWGGHGFNSNFALVMCSRGSRRSRREPRKFSLKPIFDLFNEEAVEVMTRAPEEAQRLEHRVISPEHIFLSLIAEDTGTAAEVLKSAGINPEDARLKVEEAIGVGFYLPGEKVMEMELSERTLRSLVLSAKYARQLGHDYVGPEHLLRGIIREGNRVTNALKSLGYDPDAIEVGLAVD